VRLNLVRKPLRGGISRILRRRNLHSSGRWIRLATNAP
jgi:hypothetical protein